MKLMLAAKGKAFADTFSSLISNLESLGLQETAIPTIDEKILKSVHDGMMSKFSEVIPQKLTEAGLEVECSVCSCEDQAEVFFTILERLGK